MFGISWTFSWNEQTIKTLKQEELISQGTYKDVSTPCKPYIV